MRRYTRLPHSLPPGLGNREVLGLLGARLVSLLGDQLARVALAELVFVRTGSAALSALTYVVTFVPTLLGAPLLGGLADRWPRRRVLVYGDLASAALTLAMAAAQQSVGAVMALLVGVTLLSSPWAAARSALLRSVVDSDTDYQHATAADEVINHLGQILGFLAGGVLLAVMSTRAALVLDAGSFVVSGLLLLLLVRPRAAAATSPRGERRGGDIAVGWRAALAPRCRRPVLLTWVGISLSVAPFAVAVPWAADLGAGPWAAGLLLAANPVGCVAGLVLVSRRPPATTAPLLAPLAVLTVAPLAVCAADPPLWLAVAVIAISGAGSSYSMLARVLFAAAVPDAERGRAFAVAGMGLTVGQGAGLGLAGLLAGPFGAGGAVGLCGLLGLALVVLEEGLGARRPRAVPPRVAVAAPVLDLRGAVVDLAAAREVVVDELAPA